MNILKKIYNAIRAGRNSCRIMLSNLDPQKIANHLTLLGNQSGQLGAQPNQWIVLEGLYATTTVTTNVSGESENVIFNPAQGMIMKLFLNRITGEIKMFPAKIFEAS